MIILFVWINTSILKECQFILLIIIFLFLQYEYYRAVLLLLHTIHIVHTLNRFLDYNNYINDFREEIAGSTKDEMKR